MACDGTQQETKGARQNVQEQIARRSVNLFERRAKLHQGHHVESDVDQSSMKKHSGDQAPPFMAKENEEGISRAEAELGVTDESPHYVQAPSLSNGGKRKPTHTQHEDVGNQ